MEEINDVIKLRDYDKLNQYLDEGYKLEEDDLMDLTSNPNYNAQIVKRFIENGCNVNARNPAGFTPLYNVSYHCKKDVAEILIKNGADVNAKTMYNSTPLMNCVGSENFNFDYFIFLIENGADVKAIDNDGETIVEWAINSKKSKKLIETIKKIYDNNLTIDEIKALCNFQEKTEEIKEADKIKSVYYNIFDNLIKKDNYYNYPKNVIPDVAITLLDRIDDLINDEKYYEALEELVSLKGLYYCNIKLHFTLLKILLSVNLKTEAKEVISIIFKILYNNFIDYIDYYSMAFEYAKKIGIEECVSIINKKNDSQKTFEKELDNNYKTIFSDQLCSSLFDYVNGYYFAKIVSDYKPITNEEIILWEIKKEVSLQYYLDMYLINHSSPFMEPKHSYYGVDKLILGASYEREMIYYAMNSSNRSESINMIKEFYSAVHKKDFTFDNELEMLLNDETFYNRLNHILQINMMDTFFFLGKDIIDKGNEDSKNELKLIIVKLLKADILPKNVELFALKALIISFLKMNGIY